MGSIPTSDMQFGILPKTGERVRTCALLVGAEQWPSRTPTLVGGQNVMIYGAIPQCPFASRVSFSPKKAYATLHGLHDFLSTRCVFSWLRSMLARPFPVVPGRIVIDSLQRHSWQRTYQDPA